MLKLIAFIIIAISYQTQMCHGQQGYVVHGARSSCECFNQVDYQGYDFYGVSQTSLNTCCDYCNSDPTCQSLTHMYAVYKNEILFWVRSNQID
jgi:hypothetical protein